ncbi:hypothetical protein J3R30DRAFT_3711761 [Lentinula aciculospora]|uniref:Uncharacterized protein n=1 Tax=Lentinula aciculospora TaxID=153920 RepID=A0A9W8ZYX3_9AGAR|nr:hypothetical protein J3R30DRAFT_3711761 [Lentinula aciculospora]
MPEDRPTGKSSQSSEPYSPRGGSRQRPKVAPLQSEHSESSVSGVFFAGAQDFNINGGSFQHAAGDINSTVNNDHSVKSDFNNDYRGGVSYKGAHNDHEGSTNYHDTTYNDHKGSNNTRGNYPPEAYSPTGPYYGQYVRDRNDYNDRTRDLSSRSRSELNYDYRDGFLHDPESREDLEQNKPESPMEVSRELESEAEDETTQLRQCVATFLAGPGQKALSNLADTLILAGWDRETLAHSEWGDIKDSYNDWTAPMFVRLRKICKEWNM